MALFALTLVLVFLFLFPSAALETSRVAPAHADSQGCETSSQRTIFLNLQDKNAQFVNGLQARDLTITEDKVPREIVGFETVTDQPLSVVILIDNSATQVFTLSQAKLGAQKFVEWNLRNKSDRAALVSFSLEATVEEDLTNDWPKMLGAINRINLDHPPTYLPGPVPIGRTPPIRPRRHGTTAISDAVWASTDGILKSVANSRRMIVLFTNGEDWTSMTRLSEAIAFAGSNGVAVFAIDMKKPDGYTIVGRSPLTELAEDTGGRSFALKKVQDLPAVLQKIDRQARAHYVVTYCAANSLPRNVPAKIEIEIKNSQLRSSVGRLAYPHYVL